MTQTKAELLQTRHQGDIRLGDADSSHYVGFKAPATVGTSLVWTLPAADGTANYLLKTDGSGNLGWVADSTTDSTKMPLAGGTFTGDVTFTVAAANIVFDKSDNALEFADNAKATFGASDLSIYHDGTNSIIQNTTGDLIFEDTSGNLIFRPKTGEDGIKVYADGAVELFNNNVKKFSTDADGFQLTGQASCYLDLYSYESSTATLRGALHANNSDQVGLVDSQLHWLVKGIKDGAVELYHDNVKKFETKSDGIQVTGKIYQQTTGNVSLLIGSTDAGGASIYLDGDSNGDWSGSDYAYIKHTTNGDLQLAASKPGGGGDVYVIVNNSENAIKAVANGGVELYHNSVKKIETTAQAVKITGGVAQVVTAAGALELDLNTSNYFTKTISGNSTFTFANPAASGQVTAFTLELTHSSGTVTWPSSVKWNADTAPTLTTGKTHLFMFVTDDGGTRYRGSALVDYVN